MYEGFQYKLFKNDWGVNEGFKPAVDKLNNLLPGMGKCPFPNSKNKALEKFRKAQNAMYDLFNNGLINEKPLFYRVFGFSYSKTYEWNKTTWYYVEEVMEALFTPIIQDAIKEQNI